MTEFQTTGKLELELGSGEGRRLKRQLENAVSPVSVQGQIEQHGGGGPSQRAAGGGSRQRQRARREHRWQRERTGYLEDILEAVRDIDGGGGGLSLGRLGSFGAGGVVGGLSGLLPSIGGGGALGSLLGGASAAARGAGGALTPGLFGRGGLQQPGAELGDGMQGRVEGVRERLWGDSDPLVDIEQFSWPDLPSLSDLSWPATPDLSALDWPELPALSSLEWPALPPLSSLEWPDLPSLSALSWPGLPSLFDLSWPELPSLTDLSWPEIPTPGWLDRLDPAGWDLGDPPTVDDARERASGAGETVVDVTAGTGDTVLEVTGLDEVRDELDRRRDELDRDIDRVEGEIEDLRRQLVP